THAKLLSSLQNSVYRNAFARLVGPHSEEWAKALDTDDGVLEGNAKDVAFLQFPAIQEALFKAIEASERRLEQATFTGALSGEKISGVNTVGQQQLIEMAARDKFSAPLLEVERAFSVFATHANEMVDVRGVTLHVGGKTLSPENIDGEYDVHVRFPQTNLILQSDARQIGLSEVAAFVKSKRTYQESDMQLDNVTEEETRLLDEELDALPQVHQVIVETALRERDMGELADAMEAERKALEAQAAMAQGQPGSNGASQAPIPQQGGI
ncbi:MAG: hypothetical protein Q8R28_19065, partial [Dehalococcoidia bacterium]|nr:hypothetical protein [Dehalococcoidia bacterium]